MNLKGFIKTILSDNTPLRKGKNGCYIFIHINKTGGTSIGKSIGVPIKRHLTAKEIIAIVGYKKWVSAFKFAIVRNPWDKVVSHYKYRWRTNQTNINNDNISFENWIKMTYSKQKHLKYYDNPKMFLPQVEWLKNNEGEIDIDFIGKFENLGDEFKIISNKIGIYKELPHLNKTDGANYKDYYKNAELIDIIGEHFKEDIELFGYHF